MLQNYKAAKRSQSTTHVDSQDQVTSTDQSDSKTESCDSNGAKDGENGGKETNIVESGLSEEEEVELRQLTALYEILSSYLHDYCHVLFMVRVIRLHLYLVLACLV